MFFFHVSSVPNYARRALVGFFALSAILSSISSVSADPKGLDRARAELRTLNDSGISGEVVFRAHGSELSIKGKAENMDPDGVYVSLLYDNLSVATGAFACEPGISDGGDPFLGATEDAPGRLTLAEMGVVLSGGPPVALLVWIADDGGDGERTVNGTVKVNLDRVRNMSIRDLRINGGFGPMAVVACGLIVPE